MKTRIKITAAQMQSMGWITDTQEEANEALELVIDNETKKIELQSNGEVTLSDYTFDYIETLNDLADNDLLPGPPAFGNSAVYNDRVEEISNIIQVHEVSAICDMAQVELGLYRTIAELNSELGGLFTFGAEGDEPEFEIIRD